MISFLRTHSENPDFKKLVVELDAILKIIDGEDHVFHTDLNQTAVLNEVLIVYENNIPLGRALVLNIVSHMKICTKLGQAIRYNLCSTSFHKGFPLLSFAQNLS